jgi:hypothetical protein
MNPLKNTFLILKGKIILFGNLSNIGDNPKTSPPICKYSTPPEPWAKSDKEKTELFAEHLSEVFSPHNNDQDQK